MATKRHTYKAGEAARRAQNMLRGARERKGYFAMLCLVAAFVVAGVVMSLAEAAITLTRTERILTCHFSGEAAHTHNEDCYDASGQLVCKLPERPLHTHTDACFDEDGTLICDLEELTHEHVHGPGCFTEVGTSIFDTNDFSTYALVTTFEDTVLTTGGRTYWISVTCPAYADIPEGARLRVREIGSSARTYDGYIEEAAEKLGLSAGELSYAKLLDIAIVDAGGVEVQPSDGATLEVSIQLLDKSEAEGDGPQVVHFGDEAEVLDVQAEGDTISFETEGFSVYAIVEAPEPVKTEIRALANLDDLALNHSQGFYLSYNGRAKYVSSALNKNNCFVEVGDVDGAAVWYFDPIAGSADQYRIYTVIDDIRYYMENTSGNLMGLVQKNADENDDTAEEVGSIFELSSAGSELFYIKLASQNRWLQHSNGGGGIRLYTDKNNATNCKFTVDYASSYSPEADPYGLDGMTYGIAYHNGEISATALRAEETGSASARRLADQDLIVRPDIVDNVGILLASGDADITEWTFTYVSDTSYRIATTVDGATKYLAIDKTNVSLVDEPGSSSLVMVTPGTGAYAGLYHLTVGGYALNLPGDTSGGFNAATGSGATTWMSLVEKSNELKDEDFVLYRARKVSVSDTAEVKTGRRVILYTRIWNDANKRYDYYAVDHDGTLIQVHESGDIIEWVGGSINKAVWEFVDYQRPDGSSTYYYELKNEYSGQYIAPQIANGQILSDETIGINLNGRRYGDDYSTILAWDDPYYEYAGLRTENGHVVSCPLAQAEDFYFAIVENSGSDDQLTTVETVDSTQYGITMKMVDFNNPIVNNRDKVQTGFFGGKDNNVAGLLSTNLEENGYPTTTSLTGKEQSLSKLFKDMMDVNHLFIQGSYYESGYFVYDSTQNFAHLNTTGENAGNFTVYDQLGAIGNDPKKTRVHGQFMPYNDLKPGVISTTTNDTDVFGDELPDTDPRKGEKLYLIRQDEADFFFGMEMSATFTQTPNGLDAWGHDIIFEFSGDDDFWLYVDGELVLDIGGVHSASVGTVNFRTGEVTLKVRNNNGAAMPSRTKNTTIYELFKANYEARGLSQSEIKTKLKEIFEKNEDGNYIFKDYTNHTMKMFYMERGAGASNLKMRFNLAAAKPGTVVLSKEISGSEKLDYALAEFPYQVYYKHKADGEQKYHLLGEKTDGNNNVTYSGKSTPVKFAKSYTPAGGTQSYKNVFFLKAGQTADIKLPDDATSYYIVECGINPGIYDKVEANDVKLEGEDTDGDGRSDYAIAEDNLENRPRVTYDNHVNPDALRTLTITKRLFAEDGETELTAEQDATPFTFRLYLGGENDEELELADMHPYLVKDPQGNYCVRDSAAQAFVSLGKKNYADLTESERLAATFYTSINGSISKIPAQYGVEVRNLLVGTKFEVVERESDLPSGYTFVKYERVEGSYITEGDAPNEGIIRDNSDPAIDVHNRRGWGLTVKKLWSDASFMDAHDDIYLAVYVDGNLLDGSVRRMRTDQTSIYWYFDAMESSTSFDQYSVREVMLEGGNIEVGDDGTVTGYDNVVPIENRGILTIGGTPKGEAHQDGYSYTVLYTEGTPTGAGDGLRNVRTDTVTNTRSGIRLVKTDWDGKALEGATFVLEDAAGDSIGADTYASDENGLITIAYLADGQYTLRETEAPRLYHGLEKPLTISIESGTVHISGDVADAGTYTYTPAAADDPDAMPTITIRDRTFTLKALKVNGNGDELAGARFAIYRQVMGADGNPRKDYSPVSGLGNLVSDENGTIATNLEASLSAGTYYLVETKAPKGYETPSKDMIFTIGPTGIVTLDQGEDWRLDSAAVEGAVSYTITVVNEKGSQKLRIRKVDVASWRSVYLEGAEFDLYRTENGQREAEPLYSGMVSGDDGYLAYDSKSVFELNTGTYELVETKAPDGYNKKTETVLITVSPTSVTYDEGTNLSAGSFGVGYDEVTLVYTILVSNTSGYELPKTGGPGTTGIFLAGMSMMLAGFLLLWRKRLRA